MSAFGPQPGDDPGVYWKAAYDASVEYTDQMRATIASLREKVEGLEKTIADAKKGISGCPFDYPDVDLAETDPCPVCGGLGTMDAEDKCPFPPGINTRHVGDINTRNAIARAERAEALVAQLRAEEERKNAALRAARTWANKNSNRNQKNATACRAMIDAALTNGGTG